MRLHTQLMWYHLQFLVPQRDLSGQENDRTGKLATSGHSSKKHWRWPNYKHKFTLEGTDEYMAAVDCFNVPGYSENPSCSDDQPYPVLLVPSDKLQMKGIYPNWEVYYPGSILDILLSLCHVWGKFEKQEGEFKFHSISKLPSPPKYWIMNPWGGAWRDNSYVCPTPAPIYTYSKQFVSVSYFECAVGVLVFF